MKHIDAQRALERLAAQIAAKLYGGSWHVVRAEKSVTGTGAVIERLDVAGRSWSTTTRGAAPSHSRARCSSLSRPTTGQGRPPTRTPRL